MQNKNSSADLVKLLKAVCEHLSERCDTLKSFAVAESQFEGWFKGEMNFVLRDTNRRLNVSDVQTDRKFVAPNGLYKKPDYRFMISGTTILLELKHWHIGTQNKQKYVPWWYCVQKHSSSLYGDATKLKLLDYSNSFIVVFCTRPATREEIEKGISGFNDKFANEVQVSLLKHLVCKDAASITLFGINSD